MKLTPEEEKMIPVLAEMVAHDWVKTESVKLLEEINTKILRLASDVVCGRKTIEKAQEEMQDWINEQADINPAMKTQKGK